MILQRLMDIIFSFIAVLFLSPLLVVVAVVLKFTGEGEIVFLQERIGRGGQIFKLIKFSTMLKDSPNLATGTITVKDDPRILPAGQFLRKSKINELPQLLNILMGDMSIIGPRPLTDEAFSKYAPDIRATINQVRPGLSGLGSIVFRREEDMLARGSKSLDLYSEVIAPYKGALEIWYVRHQGVFTYLAAIIATCWLLLSPNSPIVWRIFKSLPVAPDSLKEVLNYPS